MKYLYYTLYLFYKNIIKIEKWGDRPFFYCNIVLALFQTFFLFAIVNICFVLLGDGSKIDYSELWFFIIGMGLFALNRVYFKPREKRIIKELSSKSKTTQTIIVVISVVVMIFVVRAYFYSGDLLRSVNLGNIPDGADL